MISLIIPQKTKELKTKTDSLRRKIKDKRDKKTTNYNAGEQHPSVPTA